MKKILSLFLALVMCLALCVTAFAEDPVTYASGDASKTVDIYGDFEEGAGTTRYLSPQYSIGTMKFTYSDGSNKGTWNPSDHSYSGASSGGTAGWYIETGTNAIKVTSHSNCPMKVNLKFDPELDGFAAAFFPESNGDSSSISSFTLKSAEGTDVSEAPSKTVYLRTTTKNTATLSSGQTKVKLGTITITVEAGSAGDVQE